MTMTIREMMVRKEREIMRKITKTPIKGAGCEKENYRYSSILSIDIIYKLHGSDNRTGPNKTKGE
jgi:hypothetical protein